MSTALGKFLIFNVATGQACLFQFTNRAGHVLRATETGVRIDNCGNCYRTCNIPCEPDDLGHRQQPNVGKASSGVRHSRTADVYRIKASALRLPPNRSVRNTGQHHWASRDQLTQLCAFAVLCHVERSRDISCYVFGISSAFTSSSTFLASSSFQTRSTIFRACFSPIAGSTSAKNFSSTSESFSGFFACPIG